MTRQKLKNYESYMTRLKNFAAAMRVGLRFSQVDHDGYWLPSVKRITIDEDLDQTEEVACLLHELGHSVEDLLLDQNIYTRELLRAYEMIDSDNYTKKQQKLVMACEERAWKNAQSIAKRLKIPLGKWFYNYKRICLNTYK